jgi:signal transduction histidine kinase
MKKVALVFLLAVFVPSLVLAWLAVRSVRDQQFVLERQRILLYQGVADSLVRDLSLTLDSIQETFRDQVETLLASRKPEEAAASFDSDLRVRWPYAEVGFVVSLDGQVLAPSPFGGSEARKFRLENDRFLCSRESVEVYWKSPKGPINLSQLDNKEAAQSAAAATVGMDGVPNPFKDGKLARNIMPQNFLETDPSESKLVAEASRFQDGVADAFSGTVARFLQDELKVLFWCRLKEQPRLVFGAQIHLSRLVQDLREVLQVEPNLQREICVALLDDSGRPVARSEPDFTTDWKRPFVASEVGETLPHWELAVYLLNPARLGQSAQTLKLTLGLLIAILVLAIGMGGWLITADLKRQLTLARQKTDFVGNVSHELKTPLTSIRMFSEILAGDRPVEEIKRRRYLQIISAETARLTRLINNVLDFARLDRGEKTYRFQTVELDALFRDTVESYRPHLESLGFQLACQWPPEPLVVRADPDALAQILVNLLSNAEKYGGENKRIDLVLERPHPARGRLRVLDRGNGVPAGCEHKIFEQFFRAHDSLSSGIQGSGLGLTLARQIARAHGGDLVYAPRDGGGSSFTLELPLLPANNPPELVRNGSGGKETYENEDSDRGR